MMIKETQLFLVSRRKRLRHGFGAVCIGIAALLFLLALQGGAAQGLAAPLAPTDITFNKSSITSIVEPNNAINEAVAGELVTVTVTYDVSDTIYDASPYVVLMDGLYPTGSNPAWSEMYTGTRNSLRGQEDAVGFDGALIVFPDQGTITATDTITMVVYAVRTQYQYVGTTELGTTNLRIQGIIRYCADEPDCETKAVESTSAFDSQGQVRAIRPDISVTVLPTYLDADGVGAGGEQVRLTFTAMNGNGRPYAHDIVFTATLGSGLTYDASHGSDGAGAGTDSTVGEDTVVAWNVPVSLLGGASWQAVITATLPSTFTIGTEFELGAQLVYETFAGDMADEGVYTYDQMMPTLLPGIAHSKRSNLPTGTDIRIGEMLTYTVIFTQGAGTDLLSPYYMDDLPLGFHYITGTLDVQGGAVVTDVTVTAGAVASGFTKERLSWFMESMPVSDNARYITAVYEVHNTGLDYEGKLVLTASSDFTSFRAAPNSAVLNWRPPTGITASSLVAVNASVDVYQPYLANTTYFKTSRVDDGDYTREVGQRVRFRLEFRNTGRAPAYEAVICDQLPDGMVLDTTTLGGIFYSASFPGRLVEPQEGDNLLCWTLDVVPIGTTYTAQYYVEILETVMPGVPLVNSLYVDDYTSMPGDVPGERHYGEIPTAIPPVQSCADPEVGCLLVLGLTVDKTPLQMNAEPGGLVTYTLSYADTSSSFNYTNVVLTDTYDTDLVSYVTATLSPTQHSAGELVWNVGDLADTGGVITLTMEVADVIPDGVYELSNALSWSSAEIPLHTITRTIGLQAANLNLAMYGPANVHAGEEIVYTVVYSNTGSADTSPVVLTLDYNPYVEFVSSSPLMPRTGTDNVFDDTLPNTGDDHTLTVTLRVKTPLPYDLSGPLTASATLESPGAETKQANISMVLDRPVLVLEKFGPLVAPDVGSIVEYTIRVHNQGTYTATGAVITDTWGENLDYRSINSDFGWVLSDDETYATQSLGTLGIGEMVTKVFQVNILATAISYTNQIDLTTDQTTQQTEIEQTWQTSIATTKSATPVPAFPGRVLTYTVYYTNIDNSNMVDVLITDTLPSGFIYQAQSTANAAGCQSPWTFTAPAGGGGGEAVWSCATLFGNASGYFTIWGMVDVDAEGTELVNSTRTSATDIPLRPIEEPLVTPVARPWLRVDKAVAPTHPVAPGDQLIYTLTYENYGTDPAHNVIIKDQLPAQVTYVSCSGGDSCSESGGWVTWDLTEVPHGTVGSVQVVVEVTGTDGQTAVNANYTIQSDRLPVAETITGDPVSSMILDPNLAAEKLAEPPVVIAAGDRITYTIRLTNDGGGILHNVMITDAIDSKTAVEPLTLPPGCAVSGELGTDEVVTCDIGTMAQGALKAVQFQVRMLGSQPQGTAITNVAYYYSDETPSEPTKETTVWVTDGCIPPHNVDFTVSANPQAGQPVTFTASAAGDTPMTFDWVFGDTQTGSGQVVAHTYAVSDTYTVQLTVDNGCVAPVSVSKDIFVPGAPEIAWTPADFTKFADEGSTTVLEDTLTVSNEGTADLLWSVEVLTPTEATWLRIAVGAGDPETVILPQLTAPGDSTDVNVYFDPNGLPVATYTAWLRILSNDADEGDVMVLVTFTIRAPDEDHYIYLPLVLRNHQ